MAHRKRLPRAPRVLVAAPDFDKAGGVSQYLRQLQAHFPAEEVGFFTLGARKKESRAGLFFRLAADYLRFVRILSRHPSIELVHLNPSLNRKSLMRDSFFAWLARLFGKKVFLFFHAWSPINQKRIARKKGTRRRWLRFFRRAGAVAVLAKSMEADLRNWGFQGEILQLNTAVDPMILETPPPPPAIHQHRGTVQLLFLSRMEKTKGVFELLEAFRRLSREFPDLHLTMAGEGSALDGARQWCLEHNLALVNFPGHVVGEEKLGLLHMAHIYVLPSYSEGMPLSLLEAMAAGLAVVCREVGAIPDFFEEGRMGRLCKSNAPDELAEKIKALIENREELREMGRYNRRYALENWRMDQAADNMLDIYNDLLRNS